MPHRSILDLKPAVHRAGAATHNAVCYLSSFLNRQGQRVHVANIYLFGGIEAAVGPILGTTSRQAAAIAKHQYRLRGYEAPLVYNGPNPLREDIGR